MDDLIYCLVDAGGHVFVGDGAGDYGEIASGFDVDADACQKYRYDLVSRELVRDSGSPTSDRAVRAFIDRYLGTPDKLMLFATAGRLPKSILIDLLSIEHRRRFADACAALEREYTDECIAEHDPCLEGGCALEGEDEVCLQPLVRAGAAYHRACALEWVKFFADPVTRIDAWR